MHTISIASRKLYLDNSPIMASLRSCTLFALGAYGKILLYGEHVLKVPRDDDPEFRDDCYKDLMHEKDIYAHLGHSEYVVDWFENDEGIEMARMDRGSIEDYIRLHGRPSLRTLKKMIQQLVCAHCYVHDKNVILYDLFPRNILVDSGDDGEDDVSLKLCDFGNSIKLPADADISKLIVDGTSAQVDIFNLGCVIYSLVKWEVHSYDLFGRNGDKEFGGTDSDNHESSIGDGRVYNDDNDEPPWPRVLPNTTQMLCGDIIFRCWTKHAFKSVHAVRDAIFEHLDGIAV